MDACNAKMLKSRAISRASSSSSAVDSRAASDGGLYGGVDRNIMAKKSEASPSLKRKRQVPIPCPPRVEERSSSSSDKARSVTRMLERFVTYVLPDDLSTDEEIRQQATNEYTALVLMFKRDVEMISHLSKRRLNALKRKLQMDGHQNLEVLNAAIDEMASKLDEVLNSVRRLPSFNIRTNSGDQEITAEGTPMDKVTTVARYNTRKLKMGKQVTETSIVVAKKNPPSRR